MSIILTAILTTAHNTHTHAQLTMTASQTDLRRRLKALMNLKENQTCVDCPEKSPRWASLIVPPTDLGGGGMPIGAFCCLECSGSHRRLGVHIAFVRSINLDQCEFGFQLFLFAGARV